MRKEAQEIINGKFVYAITYSANKNNYYWYHMDIFDNKEYNFLSYCKNNLEEKEWKTIMYDTNKNYLNMKKEKEGVCASIIVKKKIYEGQEYFYIDLHSWDKR